MCGIGNLSLQIADLVNLSVCLLGMLMAAFYRDTRWFLYTLLTVVSFSLAIGFHCELKIMDPEKVYRYLFWVLNDFTWFAAIAYLWKRHCVYHHQFAIAATTATILIALNVVRYFDRHFWPIESYTEIYRTIMPSLSLMIAFSCLVPIYAKLWRK